MKALKIWWYKRKARNTAIKINAMYDNFSCGADLIDIVTGGRLTRLRQRLEFYKTRLREIDPKFPK